MNIKQKIKNILKGEHYSVKQINEGFEIEYGSMYHHPELGFKQLKQLSELFGTESIDVDNYSQSGCDTCDYGSDYGHTIQIRSATKNVDSIKKILGEEFQ